MTHSINITNCHTSQERENKAILIKEIERLNSETLNREDIGNHFSKLSKFIDILNEAGLVSY